MKNVLAVLLIAAGAIAALILTGGAVPATGSETGIASETLAPGEEAVTPRWEYRVLSTRVAPATPTRTAKSDASVSLVAWQSEKSPATDPLAKLEQELNRLGGEGWEMCSAAA